MIGVKRAFSSRWAPNLKGKVGLEGLFQEFGPTGVIALAALALITSTIHGAIGVAGGFLMAAAMAPIIGVAPIVPTISIALLISHSARAILNIKNFDKGAFLAVSVPAIPCIIAFAYLYGRMSSPLIAFILGSVILISVPARHWAKSRQITANKKTLGIVGSVYGALAGVSIGPGLVLSPFMLGYGLSKEAFVATIAAIALVANIVRALVFGATDLITSDYLFLGLLIGLMTIPGNWIGRTVLQRITTEKHSNLVDVIAVIGALNFFWLAVK